MGSAWIVEAVRTPVGKRGGSLAALHAIELGALPLRALVARTGIDPADVDDVVYGCTGAVGELGSNVGRLCPLEAGFPVGVPGVQVNRLEGSSDQALAFAAMGVASGFQGLVVAGGVASASRVPAGADRVLHGALADWPDELAWRFTLVSEGRSADLVARRFGLSREELDAFAVRSHRRAASAAHAGLSDREMTAVLLSHGREARRDEGIRADITEGALAHMPTGFGEGGVHTAATTAPPADGAAAVLVASDESLERLGLRPRAKVVATACLGVDPTLAYTGLARAAERALERARLHLDDVDAVEIHEGFAAVALGALRELGLDPEQVNPRGGALARGTIGGATGAGQLATLLDVLDERDARYGLSLVGIGYGQASALLVERVRR